jgi:hypothetical protein
MVPVMDERQGGLRDSRLAAVLHLGGEGKRLPGDDLRRLRGQAGDLQIWSRTNNDMLGGAIIVFVQLGQLPSQVYDHIEVYFAGISGRVESDLCQANTPDRDVRDEVTAQVNAILGWVTCEEAYDDVFYRHISLVVHYGIQTDYLGLHRIAIINAQISIS